MEELARLLSGPFMPHGHCYLWTPAMVWLQVVTNLLIALAYLSISLTLYYVIRRIKDIPFSWMYLAFGVFIITCGITHFFDVVTIWSPVYWLDGVIRAITAIASVGTAVLLFPLVPKAVSLADSAKLAHDRGLELEAAYAQLVVAHEKTKEAEKLKTRFFANVSHELRTPLTLVLGPLELLRGSPRLDDHERAMVSTAWRKARTLLEHVNDLLDIAKLEAGRMEVVYAEVDAASLVRRIADQFGTHAAERKMRFEVESPETGAVQLDPDKLERVVTNLLANAFKFTPDGGTVRCALVVDGGAGVMRLEVADSGPGVPEAERRRIFDRFTQADASQTRRFGGTGLGLAIASEYIQLHHGSIAVADAKEGGASFRVEIPARAPEGVSVSKRSREIPPPPPPVLSAEPATTDRPAAAGDAPRVLVVEDSVDMNAFIADVLGQTYAIEAAYDGEEGLEHAVASPPDLVVTDLMMPKMSGDQLVQALRARADLANVPVLLLSASVDEELRTQLLEKGAQDFLLKPFAPAELRARVANLVSMRRAREMLRREVASQAVDLETLAGEVTQRTRELAAALEALQVARDHAENASTMKSEFLGLVSHELRTPLAAAQLVVERLASSPPEELGPNARRNVIRLDRAIRRFSSLVDELLTSARIQSGKLDVAPAEFDLRELVAASVDDVRVHAEAKALRLQTKLPETTVAARTDPSLLRLALGNLLSNAVKFTKEGAVEVEAFREGDALVVKVEDTGVGVPESEQAAIFEPFRQLEAMSRKHIPGVGLGLSLVRDIARMLGGSVSVRSTPGVGSTFVLRVRAAF